MTKFRIKTSNPMKQYIGDPAPMGLFAFASITFMAAAINCKWLTSDGDAMFAPAIFYGGLVQAIAGVLDLLRGETVGGSTFMAFGMYWISHGFLGYPGLAYSGMRAAPGYKEAIGWWLLTWAFIAFASFLGFIKTTICHAVLLALVSIDFALLAIGHLANSAKLLQATGYFLLITSILAYYVGLAVLLKSKDIFLPLGAIGSNDNHAEEVACSNSATRDVDHDV